MREDLERLSFFLCKTINERKRAETEEAKLRKEILTHLIAARENGFKNDYLEIKYRPKTTRTIIDKEALEKRYPEIFEDSAIWKPSTVSESISVKILREGLDI